jgi:hypothetical protein
MSDLAGVPDNRAPACILRVSINTISTSSTVSRVSKGANFCGAVSLPPYSSGSAVNISG